MKMREHANKPAKCDTVKMRHSQGEKTSSFFVTCEFLCDTVRMYKVKISMRFGGKKCQDQFGQPLLKSFGDRSKRRFVGMSQYPLKKISDPMGEIGHFDTFIPLGYSNRGLNISS